MQILASETKLQVNAGLTTDDAKINRLLALSFSIVGLATFANLFFPPLLFLTTAGIVVITLPAYQAAYHSLRYEKRIKPELITALYLTGMWFNGYFIFGTIICLLFFLGLKIAFQIENHSRKDIGTIFGQQPRFA